MYKTETGSQTPKMSLWLSKRKRVLDEGGINQEAGINRYTILYIKQIINKDLLYSPRKSTQYSVTTYMGKESEKEWIHRCIKLNHFTPEMTQYYKSTIL